MKERLDIPALTWRRTPQDVDGARHGVPCVVVRLVARRRGEPYNTVNSMRASDKTWFVVRFADGEEVDRHVDNLTLRPARMEPWVDDEDCTARWVPIAPLCEPLSLYIKRMHEPEEQGRWWRSARGALERAVTVLEAMQGCVPPRDGWSIVDGFTAVGEFALTLSVESELNEEERKKQVVEKRRRLERVIAEARANVKRHERRAKLAETLLAKWKRKLSTRERMLQKFQAEMADEKERPT